MPPLTLARGPSSGRSGTEAQPSSCPRLREGPCLSCRPLDREEGECLLIRAPHVARSQSQSPRCSLLQQDEGGDPSSRWTLGVISGPGAEAEGGAGSGKLRTLGAGRPGAPGRTCPQPTRLTAPHLLSFQPLTLGQRNTPLRS